MAVADGCWSDVAFEDRRLGQAGQALADASGPGAIGDGQAPHIDVSVLARGLLDRVVSRIYFPDEETANAADPVLSAILTNSAT